MTYDEIRKKMIEYYENVDFVDKWLTKIIPSIPFSNHAPKEIIDMQNNPNAVAFGEDFGRWIDQQKSKETT